MKNVKQGDIIVVNLDPSKGTETKITRPCVVVSNDSYNRLLNTVIVAPISSSNKYQQERFKVSPFFITVPRNQQVHGTILLQHIRSIDPIARVIGTPVYRLEEEVVEQISDVIGNFF